MRCDGRGRRGPGRVPESGAPPLSSVKTTPQVKNNLKNFDFRVALKFDSMRLYDNAHKPKQGHPIPSGYDSGLMTVSDL